uniref:F-box domain-containing protein n=1 Tax=Strongyloides venezuelensis TaxID=75913 RepID=A0A0K0EZI6_STRVS
MENNQIDENITEIDNFDYLAILSNSLLLKKIIEKLNSYKDLRNLRNSCTKLRTTISQIHYKYKNLWYYYEYEDSLVVSMRPFLSTIGQFRYCIECKNYYDETFLTVTINELSNVNGRDNQNSDEGEEKIKYLDNVIKENLPKHTSLNLVIKDNFDITNLSTLKDFKHIKNLYITKQTFDYKYLEYIQKNVEYLDRIVFANSRCLLDQNLAPKIYLNDITDGVQLYNSLYSYTGLPQLLRSDKKLNNLYLTHNAVDCLESANEFDLLEQFTSKFQNVHIDIYLYGLRNFQAWVDFFVEAENVRSLTWFVTGYMDTSFIFVHPMVLECMDTLTNFGIIYYKDITSFPDLVFAVPFTSAFHDALKKCYNMRRFAMTLYLFEISEALTEEVVDTRTNEVYANTFIEFCCKIPPNLTLIYLDHCDILSFDELKLIAMASPHIETLILHDLRDSDICDLDKLGVIFKKLKNVDFTVAEKYASTIVLRSLTDEKVTETGDKKLLLKWPSLDIFTCKFLCDVKGLNNGFRELEMNTPRGPGRFIIKTPRRRNDNEHFYNVPSSHHEEYNEIEVTIMKRGSLFEQKKYTEIKMYIDSMTYGKIINFYRRYL